MAQARGERFIGCWTLDVGCWVLNPGCSVFCSLHSPPTPPTARTSFSASPTTRAMRTSARMAIRSSTRRHSIASLAKVCASPIHSAPRRVARRRARRCSRGARFFSSQKAATSRARSTRKSSRFIRACSKLRATPSGRREKVGDRAISSLAATRAIPLGRDSNRSRNSARR